MNRVPSTAMVGVLFDKDGTLIDFDLTWGPAVRAMINTLAGGDAARVQAQADALHFSVEDSRFLATSPLVAGSTADYGRLWAEALGRSDFEALKREINSLSAVEFAEGAHADWRTCGRLWCASSDGTEARGRDK